LNLSRLARIVSKFHTIAETPTRAEARFRRKTTVESFGGVPGHIGGKNKALEQNHTASFACIGGQFGRLLDEKQGTGTKPHGERRA
jgi:hypothetical protein